MQTHFHLCKIPCKSTVTFPVLQLVEEVPKPIMKISSQVFSLGHQTSFLRWTRGKLNIQSLKSWWGVGVRRMICGCLGSSELTQWLCCHNVRGYVGRQNLLSTGRLTGKLCQNRNSDNDLQPAGYYRLVECTGPVYCRCLWWRIWWCKWWRYNMFSGIHL